MGDDELAARMVDTTVSAGDKNKPLAAPRSASMAADINNKSAVVANKAREMKNKATGFLSKALGRFGKAEKTDESNLEETSGAFNAARREYDPSLFAEIRDGWVRRHMAARAADYTSHEPLSVSVLTWNVGAKKPPADLSKLLGQFVDGPNKASILAIGLQEAVELNASNVGAGAAPAAAVPHTRIAKVWFRAD